MNLVLDISITAVGAVVIEGGVLRLVNNCYKTGSNNSKYHDRGWRPEIGKAAWIKHHSVKQPKISRLCVSDLEADKGVEVTSVAVRSC